MVLVFGYKWSGDNDASVLKVCDYKGWFQRGRGVDDRAILIDALKIMEEADLLVAHYGDRFDRRFLHGRCVIHGLKPPPPTKQRDTWRVARTAFNFTSNRLGDLALTLGLSAQKHQKTRDEWPGWWLRAMAGDRQAIEDMAEYCLQDVRTLEQLYLRTRQYDNPHPRIVLDRSLCRLCGGIVQYRGYALIGEHKYRRFQCQECGRWDREAKRSE